MGLNFFVFLLIFLLVSYRMIGALLLTRFSSKREAKPTTEDKTLKQKIKNVQTGYSFKFARVFIYQSSKPFGMACWFPRLILLSSGMILKLSEEELEYVILHEQAHIELKHYLEQATLIVVLALLGLVLINKFGLNLIFAAILGLLFSLAQIVYIRKTEDEAENFTLENLKNPHTMIKAIEKLARINGVKIKKESFIKLLFFISPSYYHRILLAKKFIQKAN